MEIFYSASARGFFTPSLHAELPPDSVAITAERHAELLAAQEAGARIESAEDGHPQALPPPPPPPPPPIRKIAPLAFRRRLSSTRRREITQAASAALAGGDPSLQTWLDDLAASRVVDLDDAELLAGVGALQAAGLINAAEAAVLTADGTPAEVE